MSVGGVSPAFAGGVGRAGRRQRLGASIGVAVQLVGAGVVGAPQRAVAAVAGHAAALTLLAASPVAGHLDGGYLQGGALLVATVAAAVAAAVDRRELRAMAAADVCGASALQRRLVVVVEGVLFGLAALPLGLAAGAVICAVAGVAGPRFQPTVVTALVVPGLVALFAGRVRTRVTVVAAAGAVGDAGLHRRVDVFRCLAGAGFVVTAAMLSRRLRAFWELDLAFGPLVVLAALGLLLALPPVLGWIGGRLAGARSVPVALAGTELRERRRLLAPAVALGAVAALVVAVQAVVGLGLAEREQARRDRIGGADRLTAGLSDSDVFVGRTSPLLPFGWPSIALTVPAEPDVLLVDPPVPDAVADQVRAAVPGARVAEVHVLPVEVAGDPLVPSALAHRVAVGTPELLAALGLERFAGDLAAGRAVVLDPGAVVHGRVALSGLGRLTPGWQRSLPVRIVQRRVVPQYQPAVLVPAPIADDVLATQPRDSDWSRVNPAALAVGRDRPFDAAEVAAIAAAVHRVPDTPGIGGAPLSVVSGGTRVAEALELDRLDESYAIVLESAADVRLAMAVAVAVTLVALGVALRLAALTGRPDDELLDLLGARPATLRRAAVGQALVLGLLAVPLGATVGVLAARVGLAAYNGGGRFAGGVELPPIPVTVPAELVVGAILVPLATALLAGLLAHRRHPLDLRSLADRLAW